jgi:hypothetical protein
LSGSVRRGKFAGDRVFQIKLIGIGGAIREPLQAGVWIIGQIGVCGPPLLPLPQRQSGHGANCQHHAEG